MPDGAEALWGSRTASARASYETLLADRGADHVKTRDARQRLEQLYRLLGRNDVAARFATF